ncbi:MAG TPA: hypothetical protein VFQ65_05340, partial [Kofleriaceae bacterium]|nr:hypothetical protein [Kofleriaceae bacterium]
MSRRALPGLGLSLGVTLTYLGLLVVIPLAALVAKTTALTWAQFWATVTAPRAVAAFELSLGASFA